MNSLTPLIIRKIQSKTLFENYPSIILIKKHKEGANSSFVFEIITKEKIEKLITNLNIRKAVQYNDIPAKRV